MRRIGTRPECLFGTESISIPQSGIMYMMQPSYKLPTLLNL